VTVPELPGKTERLALIEASARRLLIEARDLSLSRDDVADLLKAIENEPPNDL